MATTTPPPIDPNSLAWNEYIANQPVNLTAIDGSSVVVPLSKIDHYFLSNGAALIIFGLGIGMSFVVFCAMLLLTKPEKRHTVIFGLNLTGLILLFIRCVSDAVVYTDHARGIGPNILGAVLLITQADYAPDYIFILASLLWYLITIASLLLQVRVVFGAEPRVQKYLTVALVIGGLVVMGFSAAFQGIAFQDSLDNVTNDARTWVVQTAQISFAVVVGVSSAIFVGKLLFLIHRRRKMGFKGFGPLQVICIMGCQCLIVPLAFTIASFYTTIPAFNAIGQIFISCSLPFSSLWASREAEHAHQIALRPSFGNEFNSTTTSAHTESNPRSKRSLFGLWKHTSQSSRPDEEKGSFYTDEKSDHVMIQKTLHVATSESPAPRSAGSGSRI